MASSAIVNGKLRESIDPSMQKLFSMLPPPKVTQGQSLSSALRDADTKVQFIQSRSALDDQNIDDEDYDDQDENVAAIGMAEIKGTDLVDKEEFYREQLKKHSIK